MAFAPWIRELSDRQREALHDATVVAMDECFDDLERIAKRGGEPPNIEDTMFMEWALPPGAAHLYTTAFLRAFTLAVATVGWKLAQREPQQISCVAEEIAIRALFIEADGIMETREWPAEHWGDARQEVLEDFDVDYLFDPAYDGVGEGETAAQMGIASMAFEDWFEPFGAGSRGAPHPYGTDE